MVEVKLVYCLWRSLIADQSSTLLQQSKTDVVVDLRNISAGLDGSKILLVILNTSAVKMKTREDEGLGGKF